MDLFIKGLMIMNTPNLTFLALAFSTLVTTLVTTALTSSAFAERGPIPNINSDSTFIVYYGNDFYTNTQASADNWIMNQSVINTLSDFDVVVVQPNQWTFTPEIVQALKEGGVERVLGYISIGEDYVNQSLESALGNGTGMRTYDPSFNQLVTTPATTLQSFYMDVDTQTVTYHSNGDVDTVTTAARLTPDGLPDLNPHFHGFMVYPDANWRWVLDNMRIGTANVAGRQYKAGLAQLAGSRDQSNLRDRSTNFGFDGFFLDTIDTAGPYDNAGWYPWTAQAMQQTVKFISDQYPNKLVMANRGAFYFSPGLKSPITNEYAIDYSIRPYINAFLFESFRYDSDPSTDGVNGVSEYYNENRFNSAPKVIAESNREDGFTVFGLDYQSGRQHVELDSFEIAVREMGWVNYLAPDGDLATHSVAMAELLPDSHNDSTPPTWDNTGHQLYNTPNTNMRIGAQSVKEGATPTDLVITWDSAIDQSYPIHYDISVENLSTGSITVHDDVAFTTNPAWLHNPIEHSANQAVISGLTMGDDFRVKVYAEDAKGNRNEEDPGLTYSLATPMSNPILKSLITLDGLLGDWSTIAAYPVDPDDIVEVSAADHISGQGNQANWRGIKVAHTTDTNELLMAYTNETNIYISWGFQVFIDSDDDPTTGFQGSFAGINTFPIGADYLIEGVNVYQYSGAGSDWQWIVSPNSGGYEMGRIWSGQTGEVFLPLHWIGSPTHGMNFIVFGNNDFYVDGSTPIEFDWYPDNATSGGYFRYQF